MSRNIKWNLLYVGLMIFLFIIYPKPMTGEQACIFFTYFVMMLILVVELTNSIFSKDIKGSLKKIYDNGEQLFARQTHGLNFIGKLIRVIFGIILLFLTYRQLTNSVGNNIVSYSFVGISIISISYLLYFDVADKKININIIHNKSIKTQYIWGRIFVMLYLTLYCISILFILPQIIK